VARPRGFSALSRSPQRRLSMCRLKIRDALDVAIEVAGRHPLTNVGAYRPRVLAAAKLCRLASRGHRGPGARINRAATDAAVAYALTILDGPDGQRIRKPFAVARRAPPAGGALADARAGC
jgi:hypothetical protein